MLHLSALNAIDMGYSVRGLFECYIGFISSDFYLFKILGYCMSI